MWLNPSMKVGKPHWSENCCNSFFTLHQTRWDWGNCCERFECWNFSWFVPSHQETSHSWTGSSQVVGLRTHKLCCASDEFIVGQCRGPLVSWWVSRRWCWRWGRGGDRWALCPVADYPLLHERERVLGKAMFCDSVCINASNVMSCC